MKILVTGGAGFIGSHIVDACLEQGHEVTIIDDLSTGRRENLNPRAAFFHIDIRDPALAALFEDRRFDAVSHQAALGNVRASLEAPVRYADVNVAGGLNLLECCRRFGTRKIVYASTGGCVYGEPRFLPASENHPIQPLDPYGASKAAFELYLPVYWKLYGLRYTILRYPNVYGPRQDPLGEAGVVSIFAGKMLRGERAVINGDGLQVRDFVFVSDVARANLLALEAGDNEAYNLGGSGGVSVNEIFHRLKAIVGSDAPEIHGPAKAGEVRRTYLDARKARAQLGWELTVDLAEGLARTVEYVRRQAETCLCRP